MDDSVKKAQDKGYAETLLGRRRFLRTLIVTTELSDSLRKECHQYADTGKCCRYD